MWAMIINMEAQPQKLVVTLDLKKCALIFKDIPGDLREPLMEILAEFISYAFSTLNTEMDKKIIKEKNLAENKVYKIPKLGIRSAYQITEKTGVVRFYEESSLSEIHLMKLFDMIKEKFGKRILII